MVVKLLQERFDRKEAIVESLYFKLQSLPKTGNKFADIQRVSETIEKVVRQLEVQGKSIDEQRLVLFVNIQVKQAPKIEMKIRMDQIWPEQGSRIWLPWQQVN